MFARNVGTFFFKIETSLV